MQKKFNVRINLKKQQAGIEITGLQEDVHKCVDEISKFVDDLEGHVQKDVEIDSRVHYRIIGQRGSKLRSLMREWKVDINMPRKNDDDYENRKDIITVSGSNDNVETAIIELFNLETELLAEEGDEEVDVRFKPSVPAQECWRDQEAREKEKKESQKNRGGQQKKNSYKLVDAPWSGNNAAPAVSIFIFFLLENKQTIAIDRGQNSILFFTFFQYHHYSTDFPLV